jgi:hypothetical protein
VTRQTPSCDSERAEANAVELRDSQARNLIFLSSKTGL